MVIALFLPPLFVRFYFRILFVFLSLFLFLQQTEYRSAKYPKNGNVEWLLRDDINCIFIYSKSLYRMLEAANQRMASMEDLQQVTTMLFHNEVFIGYIAFTDGGEEEFAPGPSRCCPLPS